MSAEIVLHVHPDDGQEWDCSCSRCGSSLTWIECETCGGEGLDGHDCGEDCCCCDDPDEHNLPCGVCGGAGGWLVCPNARDGEKHDRRPSVSVPSTPTPTLAATATPGSDERK